jgi:hypothetical protein
VNQESTRFGDLNDSSSTGVIGDNTNASAELAARL